LLAALCLIPFAGSAQDDHGAAPRSEAPAQSQEDAEYRAWIQTLPAHIREFVRLYEKARPGVRMDPRLYKVAERRAYDCLYFTHGHVNNLNKMIRDYGYPLDSAAFPDIMTNHFESVWAAPDAQGALKGWAGHGPHAVHVFGQVSPYSAYTKFGIGAYPYSGGYQWAIVTAP
jgi:hypothetical protein